MAKVFYSALLNCLRGKLGSSIFNAYKGTEYVKTSPATIYNPNTPRQQQVRALVSQLAKAWDSLPSVSKELWQSLCVASGYQHLGYQTFLKFNLNICCASHSELTCITYPPKTPSTPKHCQGFCVTIISNVLNCITFSLPHSSDTFVEAYFRLHHGFCGNFPCYGLCPTIGYRPCWRFIGTCRSDVGHILHNHTFPSGARLYYHVFSMDRYGRQSPKSHALCLKVP